MQKQRVLDNLQLEVLGLFEDEMDVSLGLAERLTQLCSGRLCIGTRISVNRRPSTRVGYSCWSHTSDFLHRN
ncbi:hypothetical protein CEXT_292481 [Caerostris extrusa]|uniref:Uncharacterized protein n=1 Tax=Caerostris extrusa TaxID=172846 RepID=A0AAV4W8V0_CAEEX|nr:hypothetical protein CEXT_292481 [Caerostris extrusa]